MKLSALNPFRFRALLPGVLAVGLLLGIWLGDLFKGFGWGPGQGGKTSEGTAQQKSAGETEEGEADLVGVRATDEPAMTKLAATSDESSSNGQGPIHALVDGRNYFVVEGKSRKLVSLTELIDLIKNAAPDEDGVRAMINLTRDSRPVAEENLEKSLRDAGLSDAVYWPRRAVD